MSARVAADLVHPQFPARWSPRVLESEPLPPEVVTSLFDAARWAPSCFNDQPWHFRYADTPETLAMFRDLLDTGNQLWANRAPLLVFVATRRHFRRNGKENRHAAFDAGAAWMSLALQAHHLGLHAHAMAGFDLERAHAVLGLPQEDWDILAAVAVGRRGDPATGPEQYRNEAPNMRVDLHEIAGPGPRPH